jgi:hypothetical protein
LEFGLVVAALNCPPSQWKKALAPWTLERQALVHETAELERAALGNGTGSRQVLPYLERLAVRTVLVGEEGTTLAARKLYWRLHRPGWWRRLLPSSLWVPPRPLDDLAAWVIVLRVLRGRKA